MLFSSTWFILRTLLRSKLNHDKHRSKKRGGSKVENKTIEEIIYEETDKRLKEMESPGYQFPKKADAKDVIGIVAAVAINLLLIVLCMMGVIV